MGAVEIEHAVAASESCRVVGPGKGAIAYGPPAVSTPQRVDPQGTRSPNISRSANVNRIFRPLIACLVVLGLFASAAVAQDYPWKPTRPITIVVPWSAGGSTDQVIRVLAPELQQALGVPVVVVNQPGASGSIGTANVLAADKDGYTWAAGAIRDIGTYPVLGMLDTRVQDWHVYLAVSNVSIVGVNAGTAYQTFDDLLAALRANPDTIPVATAGLSSAGHFVMENIAHALDVTYRHIPYEGGNPAVIATVAGEASVVTQLASEQAEMLRAGRLRALAAYSEVPLLLDGVGEIPAITNWIPDLRVPTNFFGIWAPLGVPAEVVETMDMIWENVIKNSEAMRAYAADRGALFGPVYGQAAYDEAMPAVAFQAWTLYDGGQAVISPADIGIPRP
jgi:tripartite-type tricarboxylate transporter receptor subunit TctC